MSYAFIAMAERTQLSDSASHLYTYSCMSVMVQQTKGSIDAYNTLTRIEQFNQKMISSKIALFSVAVLLCLLCLRRVTAQNVYVEFLTQQPSCSDEALILKCQLNFPSYSIRWEHKDFDPLRFINFNSVGSSLNTSEGRIIANLTTKNASSNPGLFLFASIVIIYPPLNKLNSTTLNNTNIICAGSTVSGIKSGDGLIILDGVPSPPANLSSTVTTSSPSVKVEWDPPLYRGHRQGIILYVITIKAINYTRSKIVNSTRRNSHIIQGGGETMIEFNKNYVVSVTTVGVCKVDSDPARISMRIEASAPLKPSLSVNLSCRVGSVRANLQWQYGVSTIYTPPTDVVINITPGPPAPPSECDQLTLSDMTCTFMTSTSTKYNIVMNLTNTIGTQLSDEVSFDSQPFFVNDSGLKSSDPTIDTVINSLCQEDTYTIKLSFGVKVPNTVECQFKENITVVNGGKIRVPSNLTLETGEEYCYRACMDNNSVCISSSMASTVVVNNTAQKNDSHILHFGVYLAVYCWCVGTVTYIALHFYWFLPIIKQDLSRTKVAFYIIGFLFASVVFPIGLILRTVCTCKRLCTISSPALQRYSYTTSHNSKMTLILFSIGAVISVIIFPLGFTALVIYYCGHKHIAEGLVRSAGIVGVVSVFPIGLLLLLASFLYFKAEERKKPHPKKKLSEMSNWVIYTVYIGEVITCHILGKRKPVAENVAQEVTEAVYAIPTEPVKENRSQPGIRSNIAYGVRHAPPSIRNPAYGYGQELSHRAQEQNQAGADDSPEYEDICNVSAEYEIPFDNRSQPRINGSGNTACGISQGSLTTANGHMQS